MFFYIETIPRDRDPQRSTKIMVEGKIFIIVHNFSFWSKFLNVGPLNLCLSVGNSPGAMLHKVLN
jgi:hypothetical protein